MIEVREVTPDDDDGVTALAALRAAWTVEKDGVVPDDDAFVDRFRAWVQAQDRVFLLALDDGRPVGMGNVTFFRRMPAPGASPSCWAYLGNVFVVSRARGAGIGGRLVGAAVARAREEAAVRLVTSPSEASRSLYRRHGFGAADGLLVLPLP